MAVVSPLLPSAQGSGKSQTRKRATVVAIAAAAFALCGVAATLTLFKTVRHSQRSTLISAPKAVAEPVYYVPLKAVPTAGPGGQSLAAGTKQPVVYYYVPETAANVAQLRQASLLTSLANASDAAGNASAAAANAFSCSKTSLVALSAAVQLKWTACQAAAKDYQEPNKGAKRRLLGWVWEGPGAPTSMLDANATNATAAAAPAGPKLAECEAAALGGTNNVCASLAKCGNPVCTSYYNEPAIEALCGMCTMGAGSMLGCFARDATTVVEGKGSVTMGEVNVGDKVMAASADGSMVSSRVYYIHDHKEEAQTVRVQLSAGTMELTPAHMMPVYTEACGTSYCSSAKNVAAKEIKAGSRVYVQGEKGSMVQTVMSVTKSSSMVRYVLTEAETVVVDGVVASVHSTAAGALETMPFRFVDLMFPGALQSKAVGSALATVLESPALKGIEAAVNALLPLLSRPVVRLDAAGSHMVLPHASF